MKNGGNIMTQIINKRKQTEKTRKSKFGISYYQKQFKKGRYRPPNN